LPKFNPAAHLPIEESSVSPVIPLLAQTDPAVGLFGGMVVLAIALWFVAMIATGFRLWMLVDAVVNEPTTEQRLLWFLVIFFLHFIGALIYFFVRRARRGRITSIR
jgi:hypothetical protein